MKKFENVFKGQSAELNKEKKAESASFVNFFFNTRIPNCFDDLFIEQKNAIEKRKRCHKYKFKYNFLDDKYIKRRGKPFKTLLTFTMLFKGFDESRLTFSRYGETRQPMHSYA